MCDCGNNLFFAAAFQQPFPLFINKRLEPVDQTIILRLKKMGETTLQLQILF